MQTLSPGSVLYDSSCPTASSASTRVFQQGCSVYTNDCHIHLTNLQACQSTTHSSRHRQTYSILLRWSSSHRTEERSVLCNQSRPCVARYRTSPPSTEQLVPFFLQFSFPRNSPPCSIHEAACVLSASLTSAHTPAFHTYGS